MKDYLAFTGTSHRIFAGHYTSVVSSFNTEFMSNW